MTADSSRSVSLNRALALTTMQAGSAGACLPRRRRRQVSPALLSVTPGCVSDGTRFSLASGTLARATETGALPTADGTGSWRDIMQQVSQPKPDGRARSHRRAAGAFTLLELLVVVAMLAVLSGLLLTALGRGRQTAQRVFCVSNLRQLGLATQMYWDENGGNAFRYRGAFTNGGDVYWFGWLARGSEGQRAFDATAGALYPYLGGRGVELCPALNYRLARFKLKATGAAYGYGYNLELSPPASQPPVNMQRLARLATLAVLADAAQVNTFQPPASPDAPRLEEFYYVAQTEPTAHFRHQGKANVGFADGHVAAETPVPGSLDARLPGETIGRLRPEILLLPN